MWRKTPPPFTERATCKTSRKKKGLFFREKKGLFFSYTHASLSISLIIWVTSFSTWNPVVFATLVTLVSSKPLRQGHLSALGKRKNNEDGRYPVKKKYLFPGLEYILFTVIIRE